MIKSQLVRRIAGQVPHLHMVRVEKIVDAMLDEIVGALVRKDRVEVRGFGAFSVRQRSERVGRNPRTGEQVPVGEKSMPYFKAGKDMRHRLNSTGT